MDGWNGQVSLGHTDKGHDLFSVAITECQSLGSLQEWACIWFTVLKVAKSNMTVPVSARRSNGIGASHGFTVQLASLGLLSFIKLLTPSPSNALPITAPSP